MFGNLGISDGNPNPIRAFWNAGIAVKSPIASRASVTLGLAYYDLISSHALQTLAPPQIPFHNEQGFEFYYYAAITKWWTMTLDIQAADPARSDAKSPLLFGLRAQIVF